MANELGLGLSPITDKIYVGTQNKKKRMWVGRKKDITDSFLDVMFEYIKIDEVREITTSNDNEEETHHFFIHFTKNKESLEKTIEFIQKELSTL